MPHWPKPPRNASFSTAAQSYDALGFAAGFLLVCSMVFAVAEWSRDSFRSPRADWLLDACEQPILATARIEAIERFRDGDGKPIDTVRAHYAFDDGGTKRGGVAWMTRGELREGEFRGVEMLPEDRDVHRLRGGTRAYVAQWLPSFVGKVLLPLLLVFGAWIAHAYRVLTTIRNGDAADAFVVELRVPEPARRQRHRFAVRCVVRVRWRAADGVERELTQRPRRDSKLGEALANAKENETLAAAFVVHDGRGVRGARLVACAEAVEERA